MIEVILVDEHDQKIGTMEKLQAHREGRLHRAFSIFILNNNGQILLQQRASSKYHSPLLWSNTCCSHPMPNEDIITAGKRRLLEELGIHAELKQIGKFHYQKNFDNGLIENEMDYVLFGKIKKLNFSANANEVAATRWVSVEVLQQEIKLAPGLFTYWLPEALQILEQYLDK